MGAELYDQDEVRRLLAEECRAAGSYCELARRWKVSPGHLHEVISGRKRPGEVILSKIGLVRLVVYADAQQYARNGL